MEEAIHMDKVDTQEVLDNLELGMDSKDTSLDDHFVSSSS
jgi:hypothetical protein